MSTEPRKEEPVQRATITPQMVIDKYLEDRQKIKALRCANDAEIEKLEASQKKREDWLLSQDDPTIFDFMTDLYLNGRDGKSQAEGKKKELAFQMDQIEKWLLKMLDKGKLTGVKTEFGTVFPTRKEGVSVEDFDALIEFSILRPMAKAVAASVLSAAPDMTEEALDALRADVEDILKSAAHFEFLNKAVNKTSVLEVMGDQDPKDHSRPNPPPPGVKYTAIRTVGVRKGKE